MRREKKRILVSLIGGPLLPARDDRRVSIWVDLDAYVTYHKSYIESVWWALSELFAKGLLYQGHKVVWWWPQGGTTLSAGEVGMGYKEVDDPAVTVRFRDANELRLDRLLLQPFRSSGSN